MKKNNIEIIIYSLGRGGAERVCVTLANELLKYEYNVKITTLYYAAKNYIDDLDKSVDINCLNAKNYIHGLFKLKKYLERNKFNKIFAFGEKITSVCNYVKIKKNREYEVLTRILNNIDIQEKENHNIVYKLLFDFSKKYMKYTDKVVFQCEKMKERMSKYLELKGKCYTIYNPLNPNFKNIDISNEKENYFIMVGRLNEQKGYKYIVEAMEKVVLVNEKVEVKILGDGPLKDKLLDEINNKKLEKNIKLIGNVPNVKDYYIKAKCLVLTSIYEGFPNVLLEANACGCPVMAFDCPTGPREIINSDNGILIDYLNTDQLKDEIINFDNNKWDYEKIVDTTKKYNTEDTIKKYLNVIEE